MKLRKETEFQETEIGKIPKEWGLAKLEKIAKIITGPFGSQLKKSELTNHGIKVYTQENVLERNFEIGNLYISEEKFKELKNFEVTPGDVLLTIRGTIGKSIKVPTGITRGIIHTNLAIIRLEKKEVLPDFVELVFNESEILMEQVRRIHSATTIPALYGRTLKQIKIMLPPLNEQKAITDIFSTVNRAIELYREEMTRLDRLKRGLMSELLTGRIRVREENGRLSFYRETELQETEIGEIPRDWHVVKLGELIEMNHGERPEVILQEGDVPIYGGGGLYGFTNTYLVDKPYVLILARVGSVGKVYLARGRVWVTDNAIYGYSKDPNGITTVYAYYWLLFDKTWIEKYVRRSVHAIITLNSLNNLKLPLPPLNEQKGITKILSTIDKAVDLHYKEKERLERLKRGLMDLLLTGKVRVKGD